MEEHKSAIDRKARVQVLAELYCGLGFLVAQMLAFMRLTFWELTWDVMEPICFFVTSLHFALAYGFFLGTSTEPSFKGYFNQRFRTKQSVGKGCTQPNNNAAINLPPLRSELSPTCCEAAVEISSQSEFV
ncbi:hypothetical protein CDL15_Pgr026334 [Punica granatum]|uniref:Calcium uniporter protein C-terminal domain-containing protein n=1 Tax=Punica granatum TaxID=22663 RepID=A0A218WXQ5_PUNGR|nr:hypothetical protein CDL15_Pgr026334 [Punica granatum]